IPAASFRLKRMLLNLDSSETVRQRVRSQVALEHVTCAKGIYRLEAELFGALGRRRPRELAIDLAGPACILVVPFWLSIMAVILGAYVLRYAISWGLVEGDLTLLAMIALGALAVAAFPAARLASLRWTQRSRAADAACEVPSVLANATLRRRLAAHVTDSLPFAGLGLLLIGDVSLFSASET